MQKKKKKENGVNSTIHYLGHTASTQRTSAMLLTVEHGDPWAHTKPTPGSAATQKRDSAASRPQAGRESVHLRSQNWRSQ